MQGLQIGQLFLQADKIADPVAVAVGKRIDKDFVPVVSQRRIVVLQRQGGRCGHKQAGCQQERKNFSHGHAPSFFIWKAGARQGASPAA